jgi:pimeloyl-ACP methyl ester carboxylesterase
MSSRFFHFGKSTLHYTILGSGPESLFMFHGFGEDNNSFYLLSQILSKQYTAYIFDLFFHGQSTWGNGELPLEKDYWKEMLGEFLKEHQIENFNVAGFSLGAKFALASLEAFPEKTRGVILLAPDGIKINFWYTIATYPTLFRKIFKSMIKYPGRFQSIVRWLHDWGLVNKFVLKFASFQMNSEEKRARVYYSWVVFRHLRFDLNGLAVLINRYKIPLTLVVGQYDKIIKPKNMERFISKLDDYTFDTPEAGHTGLIAASGGYFNTLQRRGT